MIDIKTKCFALFQQVVVSRDRLCRAPGCSERSTAGHHIFGRGASVAFNPKYGIGLCVECHRWAHAKPEEFKGWVIYMLGEGEYYSGLRLSNAVIKNIDYEQIRDDLKVLLKGL